MSWEIVVEVAKWVFFIALCAVFFATLVFSVWMQWKHDDAYWDKYVDAQIKSGKGPFGGTPKWLR